MKSIVVMTFYQMMHAIAMAMSFEEKPNLFFCMEFLNPDESLIERIGETGIFNTVTGITRRGEFRSLVKEMRKTKEYEDEELDEEEEIEIEEPEEIEETETPEGDGSPEGTDAARKDESESDDRY